MGAIVAGQTKCYAVTPGLTGGLVKEMVSFSPKHADNVQQAVQKLTVNPPQVAHVRFGDIQAVEREFAKNPLQT